MSKSSRSSSSLSVSSGDLTADFSSTLSVYSGSFSSLFGDFTTSAYFSMSASSRSFLSSLSLSSVSESSGGFTTGFFSFALYVCSWSVYPEDFTTCSYPSFIDSCGCVSRNSVDFGVGIFLTQVKKQADFQRCIYFFPHLIGSSIVYNQPCTIFLNLLPSS